MNTAECLLSIQSALDSWNEEGGQWLRDADKVLAESQRLLKDVESRERQLEHREEALQGWQRSLEQRERLLVEREKLLTEGLVQISNDRSSNEIEPVLESLLQEIGQIRQSLRQTQSAAPASPSASIQPTPAMANQSNLRGSGHPKQPAPNGNSNKSHRTRRNRR